MLTPLVDLRENDEVEDQVVIAAEDLSGKTCSPRVGERYEASKRSCCRRWAHPFAGAYMPGQAGLMCRFHRSARMRFPPCG